MKAPVKLFGLLAVIIILAAATGCDSGNDSDSVAFTELDFADDSVPWADLEEDLVIAFLEPAGSDPTQDDTGSVGIDEIPVRYTKTHTNTFCWEDDDADAMHFMELRDSEGSLVLTVEANGDCVTEEIEKGDYVMTLHNDGISGETLPVFIIPNPDNDRQARETDGLFNGFKAVIARTLKGIQNTISKDARAQQLPPENINTILKTRSCVQCNLKAASFTDLDLSGVNFTGADFTAANLSRSNLSNANFTGANLYMVTMIKTNLTDASLTGANLQYSNFPVANLTRADLSDTDMLLVDLSGAVLPDANLHGARMQKAKLRDAILINADIGGGVDLNHADLSRADLSNANFTGADLSKANLSQATLTNAEFVEVNLTGAILTGAELQGADFRLSLWCDGICKCTFSDSIGTCGGCLVAEVICTGP